MTVGVVVAVVVDIERIGSVVVAMEVVDAVNKDVPDVVGIV